MTRLLNWLFGWPLTTSKQPCYVIVYDRAPCGAMEAYEEYYGYFATPEEARSIWADYSASHTNKFDNVKLCRVVESWR